MKAVLQRVSEASVTVDGRVTGAIGKGFLLLLGVGADDTEADLDLLTNKIPKYRVFPDEAGKMNLSITEIGGEVLVVSQFTLYGTWRKGNRPGFTDAAPPEKGEAFYEKFVAALRDAGLKIATGEFGAHMKVDLVNNGPVTFVLDTKQP